MLLLFLKGLLIFLIGMIYSTIGSFYSVLLWRIFGKNKDLGSIIYGRSKCPKCKKELLFQDLLPIFSYLILKGKCRFCKLKIHSYYLYLELGMFFVGLITSIFGIKFFPNGIIDMNWGLFLIILIISSIIFILGFNYYLFNNNLDKNTKNNLFNNNLDKNTKNDLDKNDLDKNINKIKI